MTQHYRPRRRRASRNALRAGTILICVLACMVLTSSLTAATIRAVLRDRRELRVHQQLRQTELLCEAGIMRAVHGLQEMPDYEGERWTPDLSHSLWPDAVVTIRVESSENADSRTVQVIASLGSEAHFVKSMQRTHAFTIATSTPSTSEN